MTLDVEAPTQKKNNMLQFRIIKYLLISREKNICRHLTCIKRNQNKQNKFTYTTPNRYEALNILDNETEINIEKEGENENMQTENIILPPTPPPIFITTPVNYQNFCNQIKTLIGDEEFLCETTTKNLKVTLKSSQSFRQVIKLLNDNSVEYFTYQAKEEKSYRVVLKNLHHTTPTELITNELGFSSRLKNLIPDVTYLNATDVKTTDTRVPTVTASQGASAVAKPTLPTCAKNPRIYWLPAPYVGKTTLPTTEDALYTKDSKDPETRRTLARTHPFQPSPANQTTTNNTLNKTTQRISQRQDQTQQTKYPNKKGNPKVQKKEDSSWVITDTDKSNILAQHLKNCFCPHDIQPSPTQLEIVENFLESPLPMSLPAKATSPKK
ncbi:hypothetical protein QTP88_012262 [Uroleucon formosanum]